MTRWRARTLASLLPAFIGPPALGAPKTDVVVLANGDRITGEVRQLERGKLQLNTDDLGTIEIEWDKIASVTAAAPFDVDDVDGNRYLGSLAPGGPGQLRIRWGDSEATVDRLSVVRIRRLETSFWRRLDGSIDAGASYASASELFTLDVAGSVGFERPGYEVGLDGNTTLSTQPGAEETRRANLSFGYARRFENRWVALLQAKLEQNRELGFDLRSAGSGGGGRYLARSLKDRLLAGLGLSVNREKPVEGETTTNVEAMALLSYDRFSHDFPKVDVSVVAAGFASLSEGGRYRFDLSAQLRRELVKDFYVSLRGYESYDSRPATEGAESNDYGGTFAFGWSF